MRLLLDTHALIWWVLENPLLSPKASAAIADTANDVLVSAASAWEISIKHKIGKLPPEAVVLAGDVAKAVASGGFVELPVTMIHGQMAGALDGHHKDPFDRMLIAQALCEELTLVSNETRFDTYGVTRLW
ncbi:MAG: PIN domain nuclease [Alphaproteobacteria bacterium HGW-Alphaproteobacteria-3]|nr:MAG: PIN domain nuclease [Alphaproteobacteria bacterium HGW-Alphaproteobacteria-3]